jgi:hypothetical protein
VLDRLRHAQAAVQRAEDADHHAGEATAELVRRPQLVADDRELAQRGVDEALLELRVAGQEVAEDRRGEQEEGEQRDEGVVGDQRGEVGAGVVEVLVDDGDRETGGLVPPL